MNQSTPNNPPDPRSAVLASGPLISKAYIFPWLVAVGAAPAVFIMSGLSAEHRTPLVLLALTLAAAVASNYLAGRRRELRLRGNRLSWSGVPFSQRAGSMQLEEMATLELRPAWKSSISKEQAAVPHSLGSKELAEWRTGRVRSLCVALREILADYIERMEDPHQCVQLPMQAVYALASCAPDTKRKAISAARNVLFESEHLNLVRMPADEVGTDVDAYLVKYDAKGPCPYRAQLVTDAKAFYALIPAD